MRGVPLLRSLHAFAGTVVAHVVSGHFNSEAREQTRDGEAIREHTGAVCLECGEHEVVHELDFFGAGAVFRRLS